MDLEAGCQSLNWIHQAQDRVQWQVLLDLVMNLRLLLRRRNFLTS